MIRGWLRALARKFLSGRQLQARSRSARRRGVGLRLEVLEDRTVTSTLTIEPPELVEPASQARVAVISSNEIETTPGGFGTAGGDVANLTPVDGPAFERLLEDVQQLEDRGAETPTGGDQTSSLLTSFPAPSALSASDSFSIYADAAGSDQLSPSGGVTLPGQIVATRDPHVISPLFGSDGAGHIVVQLSPPQAAAQPDTNVASPSVNGNEGNAAGADQGRAPQARPPVAPEAQGVPQARPAAVPGVNGAPPGSAPTSPHAANGARAVAHRADQSVITKVAARPPQQHSDLAWSKTNGAVLPSHRADTAEASAARTEVKGLPAELPDGLLLQKYVTNREQSAFTALFQRHERFVLRICQRVLGDSHAAQDAFQLTFLVLARQAGVLDRHGPLAGWLYKVAYHLALRLRAVIARQRRCEKQAANGRSSHYASQCFAEVEKQEMRQALHEEIERLPEKYRTPLLMCYFDGRTHAEAAHALGMPRGSMAKRIGEGLERLRERLLDRGFVP